MIKDRRITLLTAAHPVANDTMKLMAEKSDLVPDQAQPQLRDQLQIAAVR